KPSAAHAFAWVVDFPLFEPDPETGKPVFAHHPFTAPHPDDLAAGKLESDPFACRALHYDAVYNGNELGSGSIRITDPAVQRKVFALLALAGVNDGNLVQLAKRLGVRVSLRGDTLTLQGPHSALERATQVAQALVDLARVGEPLDVTDVDRVLSEESLGTLGREVEGEYKIILPGLRRVIAPKTDGQREYLHAIAQHDIVIGIGPAGTGKTYLA